MKKPTALHLILLSILLCAMLPTVVRGQLQVQPQATPLQMVSLLAGPGISGISNITYTGNPIASGIFTTGSFATNLGMDSGIILTTGMAVTASGVNNTPGAGTNLLMPGDSLLNTLIPGYTTYDAAILAFDFIPQSDSLYLRFIFGSEEYPEYVNSTFNDVVGIFLSGPNPLGGNYQNHLISTLPDTTLPVSINNVNNGLANNGPCVNCQYYINNTVGMTIQYDGFTTPFTSMAAVVPGMIYRLRIAIADAGDGILDSGVFLEGGSLRSASVRVTTAYSHPGAGDVALEGCSHATVTFSLLEPAADTVTILFDTLFGTATNGIDFPAIPNGVVIPPGQSSASITITPYDDGVTEGVEFISIVVKITETFSNTITIYIDDYTPMTMSVTNDTTVTCGDTLSLGAFPQLGIPPYAFQWSPAFSLQNHQSSTPLATAHTSTTYTVTVTDAPACMPLTDNIVVQLNLLTEQPLDQSVMMGGGHVQFWIDDLGPSALYHWQADDGNGFVFMSNTGQFSGVFTHILTVSGITAANHNQRFRCLVTLPPCFEYSEVAAITVLVTIDDPAERKNITLYPNPADQHITIQSVGTDNDPLTHIEVFSFTGAQQRVLVTPAGKGSLTLSTGTLPTGIYLARLRYASGEQAVEKFVINR